MSQPQDLGDGALHDSAQTDADLLSVEIDEISAIDEIKRNQRDQ